VNAAKAAQIRTTGDKACASARAAARAATPIWCVAVSARLALRCCLAGVLPDHDGARLWCFPAARRCLRGQRCAPLQKPERASDGEAGPDHGEIPAGSKPSTRSSATPNCTIDRHNRAPQSGTRRNTRPAVAIMPRAGSHTSPCAGPSGSNRGRSDPPIPRIFPPRQRPPDTACSRCPLRSPLRASLWGGPDWPPPTGHPRLGQQLQVRRQ
jgi:hypothetical protein